MTKKARIATAFGVWTLLFIVTAVRLIESKDYDQLINIVLAWFGGVAFTLLVLEVTNYWKVEDA